MTNKLVLNRIEVSVSNVKFQMKYFPPDKMSASIIQLNIKGFVFILNLISVCYTRPTEPLGTILFVNKYNNLYIQIFYFF